MNPRLAGALLAAAFVTASNITMGQEMSQLPHRGIIPPGYDFLQTDSTTAAAQFDCKDELLIPGHVFGYGSSPFVGTITFKGQRFEKPTFKGIDTGNADTIVWREHKMVTAPNKSDSTGIRLVALSLVSVEPINIKDKDGKTSLWDVHVAVSKRQRSTGSMKVTGENVQGGRFKSCLTVIPEFTFVNRSNGEKKVLDVGAMKLNRATLKKLTMCAQDGQWTYLTPKDVVGGKGANFCPANAPTRDLAFHHDGPGHKHVTNAAKK
jgi:hypothetical protein